MKKKTKAVLTISVSLVIGLFLLWLVAIELGFVAHLEGYKGYCSSTRLPYIFQLILMEIALAIVVVCLYIYSVFFVLEKKALKSLLIALTFNSFFTVYKVIEYPLLVKVSSGWGNSKINYSGVLINPMFFLSIFFCTVIVWVSYRYRKIISDKLFRRVLHGIAFSLIIITLIVTLNNNYEKCFG